MSGGGTREHSELGKAAGCDRSIDAARTGFARIRRVLAESMNLIGGCESCP